MNSLKATCAGAALLGMILGSATAAAQQQQQRQLPSERSQTQEYRDINWNEDMRRNHAALMDACKEVVTEGDRTWARFDARFVRVERDGQVVFSVRDQRDRSVEEVRLTPKANQVAYINDRPTPFRQLRSSDSLSLYVPEGAYGFATEPGGELATVSRGDESTASRGDEPTAESAADRQDRDGARQTVAQRGQLPSELPRTAGPLPWFALGGLLSLLGGLGLTLRRKI